MTTDEWKEENWPFVKWQFKTIGGRYFFGLEERDSKWSSRQDYPIRYFLWKTNRDVWRDFWHWQCTEAQVLAAATELQGAIATLSAEISYEADPDVNTSRESSLRVIATAELDADETLLNCLFEDEWIDLLGNDLGMSLTWEALGSLLALIHIADSVKHLDAHDIGMAGAFAIKAQMWQSQGRYQAGRLYSEQEQKRRLAESGADAAHLENRRVRALAIDAYLAGSWPSKMQAARVISGQVKRTEMVVMRWIREHLKESRS